MNEMTQSYFCEECNQRYSTLKQAEDCQKKILEGPILEQGLILKDTGYIETKVYNEILEKILGLPEMGIYIFKKESQHENHQRRYIFYQISFGQPNWMSNEDYEYGKKHSWTFIERYLQPRDLKDKMKLSKEEFLKIKEFIETHPKAEKAREFLRKSNLLEKLNN